MNLEELKLCVVGLGYVGLPLAVEFGKKRKTLGFDINKKRIEQLKKNIDCTLENSKEELCAASLLSFSSSFVDCLRETNFFKVCIS